MTCSIHSPLVDLQVLVASILEVSKISISPFPTMIIKWALASVWKLNRNLRSKQTGLMHSVASLIVSR